MTTHTPPPPLIARLTAELERANEDAKELRIDSENMARDWVQCQKDRNALAERVRALEGALATHIPRLLAAFHWTPCAYCGKNGPHEEATDCGECDGHGRAPSEEMKNNPEACMAEADDALSALAALAPQPAKEDQP